MRYTIKARLAAVILLALLPAFLFAGFVGWLDRKSALREAAFDLREDALRLAAEGKGLLEGARRLLDGLGNIRAVRTLDPAESTRIFRDIIARYPDYTGILAFDPSGEAYATSFPDRPRVNIRDRGYYAKVMLTRQFVIGDYQFGRVTGKPVVVLAHPILGEDMSVQAVVTVSIDLNWLERVAARTDLDPGTGVSLVDRNGVVLSQFPPVPGGPGQTIPLAESVMPELLSGARDVFEAPGRDGNEHVFAFAVVNPEKGNELFVRVGKPVRLAYAKADRRFLLSLGLLGLTAAAVVALVRLLGDRLLARDIRRVRDGAHRIAEGDLSARIGRLALGGEPDELAQSFDRMAVSLEALIRERDRQAAALTEARDGLELRVGERTAELTEALTELRRAKEKAEAASRAKTDFLASVSHELRTPLNPLLGMLDLALEGDLPRERREWLLDAKGAALRLHGLVDQILDLTGMEDRPLQPAPVGLRQVLETLRRELAPAAEAKGLALTLSAPPSEDTVIVTDYDLLRRVLARLGENAVKFTRQGSVTLGAELAAESEGAGTARFTVADTGVGIPEDRIEAVSSGLTQADSPLTRRYGGLGLGLAVVRKALALLGGTLELSSRPGRGTVAVVSLPVRWCRQENLEACLWDDPASAPS